MAVPFILALTIQQAWNNRLLFSVLGLLIAFVVCLGSIFIAGLVLTPLYELAGISTSLYSKKNELPTHIYLNWAFYLVVNIGVTYWVLRQLAQHFKHD